MFKNRYMQLKRFFITAIGATILLSACTTTPAPSGATAPTPSPIAKRLPEAAPTPSGRNLQPQLENITVDLDEVVALLPPDAIPAILPDEVPRIMVSAAEADAGGMAADTRVLGISINGESRAYPIPFMSRHEIVNDVVGGKSIAATW